MFFRFAQFVLQGDDVVLGVLKVVVMCEVSIAISTTGMLFEKQQTHEMEKKTGTKD